MLQPEISFQAIS